MYILIYLEKTRKNTGCNIFSFLRLMNMENLSSHKDFTLTKSESGTFFSTYLRGKTPNKHLQFTLDYDKVKQAHSSLENAELYFKAVDVIHDLIKKHPDHHLMIAWSLSAIEAWTCPITAINRYDEHKMASHVVNKYKNDFKKMQDKVDELSSRLKKAEEITLREEDEMFQYCKLLGIDHDVLMKDAPTNKFLNGMSEGLKKLNEYLEKKDEA